MPLTRTQDWPAWRYGPNGEADQFNAPEDVPEGWKNHPSDWDVVEPAPPAKAAEPAPTAKAAEPAPPATKKVVAAAKAAAKAPDFDRAAAVAALVAKGFTVEKGTTDVELKAAVAEHLK